ncbi:hypothetical protein ACI7BZ_02750 [Xanthobacter sp. AM11]|uniref:hypothetical protein n=1 Tax=Xanthobacter sp. AM11 TaxID=3380643 RepID=UPI0039BF5F13
MINASRPRRVYLPLRRTAVGGVRAGDPSATGDPSHGLLGKLVLAGALPMFAQVFHYLNELPPTYFLSKGWPFLTMPLAFYGMAQLRLPVRGVFFLVLAYTLSFTPFVSILQLGNAFLDALTTTIKVWPITYYFSASVVLALLAVPLQDVRKLVIAYGITTFSVMVLLFLFAPVSWYSTKAGTGKLMLYEMERGFRIYMPMFFGMILIFFLARSSVMRRKAILGVFALMCFLPLIFIYKQRIAIAAAFLVAAFGVVSSLPAQLRRVAYGLALVAAVVGLVVLGQKAGLFGEDSGAIKESLGGSLTVRQNSLALAFGFLGEDPLRWAFGVGATTRFSTVTLNDIFGNRQFFISDLGWVGIIFEYGLVGAALLALLYGSCLVYLHRVARASGDPLSFALADFVLYVLLTSTVYSVVFTPGELGVAMALGVYMDRCRKAATTPAPLAVPASFDIRQSRGKSHVSLGRITIPRRGG